ncbi:MAG: glycosyltransferase [Gemmiger sp.]|nr:glycosyltransferase [Gemmiger sp.]
MTPTPFRAPAVDTARIAVIVPIHNAAAFLPVCLASLAGQSHQNLSCLLVEDGSTDASAEICRQFAARDARFTLLCQPQCGVSAARATGLAAAKADYIAFADADDLYHPAMLATLLQAVRESGMPVACCRYAPFTDAPAPNEAPPTGYTTLAAPAHQQALLRDHRVDYALWNKLYRADLLTPALLDAGYRYNEDLFTNWQVFAAIPGIVYCDFAGYHYRQHSQSASHRALPAQSLAQQQEIAGRIRALAAGTPLQETADCFYYEKLTYLASMILRRQDAAGYAPQLAQLRAALAEGLCDPRLGKNPALPPAIRLAAVATARLPGPYGWFCRHFLTDRQ